MAADTLEAKEHAHQLLDQLGPNRIAAVFQLLNVMVEPEEEEPPTEEDRRAVAASREYFRRNPEGGVSLEQVAAGCGSPWIRSAITRTENRRDENPLPAQRAGRYPRHCAAHCPRYSEGAAPQCRNGPGLGHAAQWRV